MAVTVLEWRSRRQMNQIKRWTTAPGHASLVLTYPDHSGKTHGFAHTITWFPEGASNSSGSPKQGSSATAFGSRGKWVPDNIFDEMRHMGGAREGAPTLHEWLGENGEEGWVKMYKDHLTDPRANYAFGNLLNTRITPPDRSVTITTQNDPGAFTGLNDSTIRTWWRAFADNHDTYKFLSRSCSAVVGMALVAGGAEEWESKPAGFWTPDSVYDWAVKVSRKVQTEQERLTGVYNQLKEEAKKFPNPGEVWTKQEWYRASEANVSFLSRRYGLLTTIDTLLEIYHTMHTRDLTEEFRLEAKNKALMLIMDCLIQILRERGGTKRRAAIGQLAAQIINRFNEIKRQEEEEARRLEHEREVLLQEIELHNKPINERLNEIAREQRILMIRMSSGKIKDLESMQKISQQMQLLREETKELNLKLRTAN